MRWGLAIVLCACGRIGFDGQGPPPIADASDALGESDCWPAWRAGTVQLAAPRRIDELSTTEFQMDPSISGDGLTLYFAHRTNTSALLDVMYATRPMRGAPFGPATPFTELNTPMDDGKVSTTGDGDVLVVVSNRLGDYDLLQTKRSGGTYSTPSAALFTAINVPFTEQFDPVLVANGLRIYFSPNPPGGGQSIQVAARTTVDAPFGSPTTIMGIPHNSYFDPALSPDELVLAYGATADGSRELFYATRATVNAPFANVQRIPGVNVPVEIDGDPSFTADGCELFFSSDRIPANQRDLYVAEVIEP